MGSNTTVLNCVICGSPERKKGFTYCLTCADGVQLVCPQCSKPLVVEAKKYIAGQRRNPERSWVHEECRSAWLKTGVWTEEKRAITGAATKKRLESAEYRANHKAKTAKAFKSVELRAKCSASAKKRFEDTQQREIISNTLKELNSQPEYKQEVSERMQTFWDSDAGTEAKQKISESLGEFWTAEQRQARSEFLHEFYQTDAGLKARQAMTDGRIELFASTDGDILRSRISAGVAKHAVYKVCCEAPDKDLSSEALESMRYYWKDMTDTELLELHRDIYLNHLDKTYLENLIVLIRTNIGFCTRFDLSLATGLPYLTVSRLFKGEGCFDCVSSGLQQSVLRYVQTLYDSEIQQNIIPHFFKQTGNSRGQELDIYIPDKAVAIEVNGTYWHSERAGKCKKYHYVKSKLCRDNGIRLIHIWEHEWNNPVQQAVLKSIIQSALGLSKTVYARKLKVEYRKSAEMREFFTTNNIQGFRGGAFAACLVESDTKEVLLAYLIGKGNHFSRGYKYEVVRGACKLGYNVVGGFSKVFKHLFKDHPEVDNLVYYIDYNYFDGRSLKDNSDWKFKSEQVSFKNYIVATGEVKNRNPGKHKEITQGYADGSILKLWNAGVASYIYNRANHRR